MMNHDAVGMSEYIIREVNSQFRNPAVLWSGGKDSTAVLGLIRDSLGSIPWDVVFIETGFDFPEVVEFRNRVAKEMGFNLKIARHETSVNLHDNGREACCYERKTVALKDIIHMKKYDAVVVGIRHDEQEIRNKERYISPRDKDFKWDYQNQPLELVGWNIVFSDFPEADHVRVHPILHWSLIDVWEYIKEKNLPVNPLYFKGYTSIGCAPCTFAVSQPAKSIDEIIERIRAKKIYNEREGRLQDSAMQKLRALGYM